MTGELEAKIITALIDFLVVYLIIYICVKCWSTGGKRK